MYKTLLVLIFTFIMFSLQPAFCAQEDTLEATYAQTAAIYTNYKDCIRLYKMPFGKLFYLTLSSVNANKYTILEMQSRNGYIIFETGGKEFLLNVMKKDKYYTFLRLSPADNNYYFSTTIPQNIFRYIDLNFNADIKELKF